MFLKLTNANESQNGQPIIINSDSIVSINRGFAERNGTLYETTYIFMPPHGTWEVQEPLDEILELLEPRGITRF